jgi:hypothetical protein
VDDDSGLSTAALGGPRVGLSHEARSQRSLESQMNPFLLDAPAHGLAPRQRDRRDPRRPVRLHPISVLLRAAGLAGVRGLVVFPRIYWVWPISDFFVTALLFLAQLAKPSN